MQKKIMFSIDEKLLAEIEAYADEMHLNRSAAVTVLCSTALQQKRSLSAIEEFIKAYKAEKEGENDDGQ